MAITGGDKALAELSRISTGSSPNEAKGEICSYYFPDLTKETALEKLKNCSLEKGFVIIPVPNTSNMICFVAIDKADGKPRSEIFIAVGSNTWLKVPYYSKPEKYASMSEICSHFTEKGGYEGLTNPNPRALLPQQNINLVDAKKEPEMRGCFFMVDRNKAEAILQEAGTTGNGFALTRPCSEAGQPGVVLSFICKNKIEHIRICTVRGWDKDAYTPYDGVASKNWETFPSLNCALAYLLADNKNVTFLTTSNIKTHAPNNYPNTNRCLVM